MLTPKEVLFHAAMSSDPPLLTDDPVVNHMVDQMMDDSHVPYDADMYLKEIAAWKLTGGFLLSYSNS